MDGRTVKREAGATAPQGAWNADVDCQSLALNGVAVPTNLLWLAECVGAEDTLTIVEKRGGVRLYVPAGEVSGHNEAVVRFEAEFGRPLTLKMIRYFGGSKLQIPLGHQWLTEVYTARGETPSVIALKLRCTESTVWRRLNPGLQRKRNVSFDTGIIA